MNYRVAILAFVIGAAACGAGCLGRSLAADTGRIVVGWSSAACEQVPMPWVRIRSVPRPGVADDEVFDWAPCIDELQVMEATTAPLDLGVYDVSIEIATDIDGDILAVSSTSVVSLDVAGDLKRTSVQVWGALRPIPMAEIYRDENHANPLP